MKKIFIVIFIAIYIITLNLLNVPNIYEFIVYPLVGILLISPLYLEIKKRLKRKKELKKQALENLETNMEFSNCYANFLSKQKEVKRYQRLEAIRIFSEIFIIMSLFIITLNSNLYGLEELYSGILAILTLCIILFETHNFKYENKIKTIFFETQNNDFLNLKFNLKPSNHKIDLQQYLPSENHHVTHHKNHFVGKIKNSIPIEFLQFETATYKAVSHINMPTHIYVDHDMDYTVLIRIDKNLSQNISTQTTEYSSNLKNSNNELEKQIINLLDKYKKDYSFNFKIYIGNIITIKFPIDEELLKTNLFGEPINKVSIYNFYIITKFIKELMDIFENY